MLTFFPVLFQIKMERALAAPGLYVCVLKTKEGKG